MELKTILITQARTGSTRLPRKVLMEINKSPLLKIHLDRLNNTKKVDKIIVATTYNVEDNIIEKMVMDWGFEVFRGSENDVLDRYYQSVINIKPTWVVRVTSDCPLLDPELVDAVISFAQVNDVDYASNGIIENFPDGQDVEVFKFSALEKAWREAKLKSEREHVTSYIRNNSILNKESKFLILNFPSLKNYSNIRMTVDEHKDFELIEELITNLGTKCDWLTYTHYIINNELNKLNCNIIRNEGFLKSLKNDLQNG